MFARKHRLLLLLTLLHACAAPEDAAESAATEAQSAGVVDSVFPMDVMLARFREGVAQPEALGAGAANRDSLVARAIRALAAQDTSAFQALSIDLPVFAWLYFPTTATASAPYELPPGLAWLQLEEENRKGLFRALRELGGHDVAYGGHECDPTPASEGDNRIWTRCTVTIRVDGGEPRTARLFSSILERDGHFVVLSWANDF
jgi:hypothetical protein